VKATNEVLPERSTPLSKSAKPKAVSAETKKVGKRATTKKAKAKPSARKSTGNSKNQRSRLLLLREQGLGPEFHQAPRSPMSQMLQQTLWLGGTDREEESQQVELTSVGIRARLRQPGPERPVRNHGSI
jgi:hypothetical protein